MFNCKRKSIARFVLVEGTPKMQPEMCSSIDTVREGSRE